MRRTALSRRMRIMAAHSRRGGSKISIVFILLLIVIIGCLISASFHIRPIMTNMATARVSNLVTRAINSAVAEEMLSGNISYDKLITLEKDTEGKISALKSNMVEINQLQSQLVSSLIDRISKLDTSDLNIPLGNLFGNSLFSGRGPKIPIRILSVSSASAAFSNHFTSAGINQTRHQIILDVKVQISILVPGVTTYTTVDSQVSVAETVIVGSVPDSFTYFSDTKNAADAAENYFNFN